MRIGFLPYGYSTVYLGGYPYYYYNGTFYQPYGDDQYEVVDPPMGASVYDLPEGARAVIINGEKMYELNGTYYKEDRDSNGRTIYTVIGKNGEVNNTGEVDPGNVPSQGQGYIPQGNPPMDQGGINTPPASNMAPPAADNATPPTSQMQIGDITNQLPEGSKVVTIDGQKLYMSPDNTYFSEETAGGSTQYKVVGK